MSRESKGAIGSAGWRYLAKRRQPGARALPFALNRSSGDLQSLGCFIERVTGKEAALDDAGHIGIHQLELFEQLVDGEHLLGPRRTVVRQLTEIDVHLDTAALVCEQTARIVDDDAAHGPGGNGVEMPAIVPVQFR